jgi:flagellar protein FliJ
MKRFEFKLQKLLTIKEHNEQIAKERYAAELQKKIKLEIENKTLSDEIYKNTLSDYRKFNEGEIIGFDNIFLQEQFVSGTKLKILDNISRINDLEPLIQKLKEELTEAMKERKMMDKLKEHAHEKYKDLYNKHEIKVLDDIAGNRQLKRRSAES